MFRTVYRILFTLAALLIAVAAAVAVSAPPAAADPTESPGTTQVDTTNPTETTTTATPTDTPSETTSPTTTDATTPTTTTTEPGHGTGTVTVQAIDLKTHVPVSGVGVELRSGDVVTTVYTSGSYAVPAGVVSATVASIPDGYARAWVDPASANLPEGGSASFIVSLVREGQVGAVAITKRDAVTGALLTGARYRITASRSDQSVVLVTGPSGTGSVQLAPGGYDVQEIAAPTGYLLDSTVRFVEVTPSQTRYLELYDSPITPPVVVRNPSEREPLTSIPTGRTH